VGTTEQTILIIEDEPATARLIQNVLDEAGFTTVTASTADQASALLRSRGFALITLDLGLGRSDGLDIARSIRARSAAPILIISGRSSDIDRIVGLEIGADDYVTKPFNVREVLARVKAILRRTRHLAAHDENGSSHSGRTMLRAGPFLCDFERRSIRDKNNIEIDLTSREFALLEVFLRRPQRVLSRDLLIEAIPSLDDDVLDRAIDTIIGRLRRKLGEPSLIKTIRGEGYMFTEKVTVAEAPLSRD
jgi:two-component system, OmpR family, response regulator